MGQRWAAAVGLLCLTACDLPAAPGLAGYLDELQALKGSIILVEETDAGEVNGARLVEVRLVSSTGIDVTASLLVPAGAVPGDGRPGVLLVGGRDTGSRAPQLLPEGIDELVLTPDYPGLMRVRGEREVVRRRAEIREEARRFPATLMLLLDYLEARPEVDAERIAAVGASFGGFFVAPAAAADARIRNVALLYTGGDLAALASANLDRAVLAPVATLGADIVALPFQFLEPVRWVGAVWPRPLLMAFGLHDDRIPRASAEAIVRAARPPKDVIWLQTGHLSPDDEPLIRELVDSAFSRLPLLQR